jgi:hypothetical protein
MDAVDNLRDTQTFKIFAQRCKVAALARICSQAQNADQSDIDKLHVHGRIDNVALRLALFTVE